MNIIILLIECYTYTLPFALLYYASILLRADGNFTFQWWVSIIPITFMWPKTAYRIYKFHKAIKLPQDKP